MTAAAVCVVIVSTLGLVAFRWWLEFNAAAKSADRQLALETARAAPVELVKLAGQVEELRKAVADAGLWERKR